MRILRFAERTGRAGGAARHPVWVTELNWDTRPPDPKGVPADLQRRWVARALYRLSAEGVQAVFWHFVSDPPDSRHPAGLWHADDPRGQAFGRPKPALAAFRFPFVAVRETERRLRVWGLLPRPGRRRRSRSSAAGGAAAGGAWAAPRSRPPGCLRASRGARRRVAAGP